MEKALRSLDDFLRIDISRNHHEINAGGCCMFAGLLASYLEKVGGAKTRVRVVDWYTDEDAIKKARPKVKRNTPAEWNEHGVHFNHVAVEFIYKGNVYHIDARGITTEKRRRFTFLKDGLTVKEATELGSTQRGWNRCFDRREIPAIKRRVAKYFRKHLKKGVRSTRLVG
jgi:hypothetical protein